MQNKRYLLGATLLCVCASSLLAQGTNPGRRATDARDSGGSANRYLIEFRSWGPQARAAITGNGGRVVHEFPEIRTIAAEIPAQAAQALSRNPQVSLVEVDPPRYMMSVSGKAGRPAGQAVPYGINMVQADQITTLPNRRKVCIIDSGYYLGHEDLQTSSVGFLNDPGTGDASRDASGHGTHVAGTIAAMNNAIGVVGVNNTPALLDLVIVKVFGDDGKWAYSSTLIAALNQCRNNGANVVSMSLGGERQSRAEKVAFANAYAAGVLSVAAAGNDGNTRKSYPASYDSVISVAAIDNTKNRASFSQRNGAVELAAPGVAVLSTVPYIETNTATTASGVTYSGGWIENAARTSTAGVSATLVDGGLCTAANAAWSGKVVLCQRGTNSFVEKVSAVQAAHALAAIVYNNVEGGFAGTLGDGNTSTIPAISLSLVDGTALKSALGTNVTVVSNVVKPASGYEAWDGTSMATPHVSGVAALIWAQNPQWTNAQIRRALQMTAQDLGAAGRDTSYGFGLVQAKAALDFLLAGK